MHRGTKWKWLRVMVIAAKQKQIPPSKMTIHAEASVRPQAGIKQATHQKIRRGGVGGSSPLRPPNDPPPLGVTKQSPDRV